MKPLLIIFPIVLFLYLNNNENSITNDKKINNSDSISNTIKIKEISRLREYFPDFNFTATINKKKATIYEKPDLKSYIVTELDSGISIEITGITEFNIEKFYFISFNQKKGWIKSDEVDLTDFSKALIDFHDNFYFYNKLQSFYNESEIKLLRSILTPIFTEKIFKLKESEDELRLLDSKYNQEKSLIKNKKQLKKVTENHQIRVNFLKKNQIENYLKLKKDLDNISKEKIEILNKFVEARISNEEKLEIERIKAISKNKDDSLNLIESKKIAIENKRIQNEKVIKAKTTNKERLDKLIFKYGEINGNSIFEKKVWIGMTEEMLLESLGKPQDVTVTETIYGKSKWYRFIGRFVRTENGIVTVISSR